LRLRALGSNSPRKRNFSGSKIHRRLKVLFALAELMTK